MSHHELDDAAESRTGRTVVGMFERRADVEAAIRDLKAAGFTDGHIGVAMHDSVEQREVTDSAGGTAAEGAAAGAVSGGMVGGLIGLLGSLLIPGVGPIVVGGVLASALTGAGVGAATGGVIGALMGLGVPEADAQHFDLGLRAGRTLVTVDAGVRTSEALAILARHDTDFGPSGTTRYGSFDRASGSAGAAGAAGDPITAGLGVGDIGSLDAGVGGAGGSDAGIGSRAESGLGGIGMGDVASGSSSRGMPTARERQRANERRTRQDPAYAGPERRLVGV
ncbi:MAG TPA: general stress protein [Gemmatimonadales bacterium]|nr:general stress protein [Gemmatimonadales bacterium]